MENHTDKSTNQKVPCPADCGLYEIPRLQEHINMSNLSSHMVWIMAMVGNIRKEIDSLTQKINTTLSELIAKEASDISSIQNQILDLESRSQQAVDLSIDLEVQQAVAITLQAFTDKIRIVEIKLDTYIGFANCLLREHDKIKTEIEKMEERF